MFPEKWYFQNKKTAKTHLPLKKVVELRFFQNASIEMQQISFIYQQNHFTVKKLICKMQNKNSFTDKRFFWLWKEILEILKDWICRKLHIVRLSAWFHLTGNDLNWEELPMVCLPAVRDSSLEYIIKMNFISV